MFRAAVLLALASVLLTALALISCLSIEDKRLIRGMPRAAWVAVIALVPLGGAIAWFLAGRPRPAGGSRIGRTVRGGILPDPPRPRAPDDDPDFLRSLERNTPRSSEAELLRQWEEDLREPDGPAPGGESRNDPHPPEGDRREQQRAEQERAEQQRAEQERREQERRDEQQRRDLGTDG